jgi:hypothetical protein
MIAKRGTILSSFRAHWRDWRADGFAFWLAEYVIRILENVLRNHRPLIPIVPWVFYNNARVTVSVSDASDLAVVWYVLGTDPIGQPTEPAIFGLEGFPMLELMLIVALLIFGTALGGLAGTGSGNSTVTQLLAIIGGVSGTALAYFILAINKTIRSRENATVKHPRTIERTAISTHRTFKTRLANYLGIGEAELLEADSYKSSMPFWSMVDVYWRRTTKTAQQIREVLLRIRERLRGPD